MHIDNTRDRQQATRDIEDHELAEPNARMEKKPFQKPELIQHDGLPQVTTGFFGSFP